MEERASQRKLAAIMIADVVGFSKHMSENEEKALSTFGEHRQAMSGIISRYHGRVFGGAGDSVVAEFPSAIHATEAAVDIQAAVDFLDRAAPANDRMLFRIGINVGDVIVERRNLFGDGVNVAERLQALAPPGGICISGTVHDQVRYKLPLEYFDLGEQQLKNIGHPVNAFIIGAAKVGSTAPPARSNSIKPNRLQFAVKALVPVGALLVVAASYFLWPGQSGTDLPASGPPKIAVLPFQNQSGDTSQDYFSLGISEDISAELSRFSDLAVLASAATAQFKGGSADPDDLRQKLGARYLVVGSVRRSGDLVRVAVGLTDTDDKLQIWSQQFERQLSDIFEVQDEITRNITAALALKLTRLEQERALAKQTANPGAYDYFLRGRAQMANTTRADAFAARAMFEKAIELDPRYATAIIWLGLTYQIEATMGWTEFGADALNKAEQFARQALGISPDMSEAHQLLGFIYLGRGDYDRGLIEAKRAIEINPSDAYSYSSLGAMLMYSGDAKGAVDAIEKARFFDPTLKSGDLVPLGLAYFMLRRFGETIDVLEPLEGGSDYTPYVGLAAAYAELGREEDARQAALEVRRLQPFFKVAQFVDQWRDERSRTLMTHGLKLAGLD